MKYSCKGRNTKERRELSERIRGCSEGIAIDILNYIEQKGITFQDISKGAHSYAGFSSPAGLINFLHSFKQSQSILGTTGTPKSIDTALTRMAVVMKYVGIDVDNPLVARIIDCYSPFEEIYARAPPVYHTDSIVRA